MDTVSNAGAAIGREIAAGEAVEKELDAFVSRRDAQRRKTEGERAEEEAWVESSRRHRARQDAEERAERATIDRALLEHGQAPRNIVRRYRGLSRRAFERHRDGCLAGTGGGG